LDEDEHDASADGTDDGDLPTSSASWTTTAGLLARRRCS
jgi:hypothetical protein